MANIYMLMLIMDKMKGLIQYSEVRHQMNDSDMKGQRFTFTIEPDIYLPLKEQAKKERRSIGSLLNFLSARYLEEQQGIEIEQVVKHGGDRKNQDHEPQEGS
ncbi:MAG: hypothetical protein V7L23_03070 [Nostoc sp.]|uniref:hypothetical protein n=1 Tax=Nostoc sp. TaxID=1180 RepID=UPI002FF0E737